jgi:signal transduction histidine kinase
MDIWQLLGAGFVGLWLGGILALTRLSSTPLSGTILGFAVCAALWALGDLIATYATDILWKQVGIATLYSGAIFVPALWWSLSLRWAEGRGINLPVDGQLWTRVPLAYAGVMWLLMLTNPWHGHFMQAVIGGRNVFGPLWWLMALPNYALILAAGAVELRALLHADTPRARSQSAFMIAASGITLLANWAYMAGLGGPGKAPVFILSAAAVILVIGMLRQGLFGVLPVALPVIASNDPDGLLVVRSSGHLVHANPRARTLLAPVELAAGARLQDLLAPRLTHRNGVPVVGSDRSRQEGCWRALLRPGGALYRYDNDDQARWLRISGQPVHAQRGRLVAHCLRIHDATDEQRAELELHRARRLESVAELSRGVAHDFHNLLAVVRGNAELLRDIVPERPDGQRQLSRILQASEQAAELADQLQLYTGDEPPTRVRIDLSILVRDMSEVLDAELFEVPPAEAIDIELDLASEPLAIEADATQVRQLLLNLFVNARDALEERGGTIRVTTGRTRLEPANAENLVLGREQPAADYAYLMVSDTGVGIEADAQERIFEPFFSTKGKKRGIGLSTVFGIARAHDAVVELVSHVGRGTAFRIYLPAVAPDPPPS